MATEDTISAKRIQVNLSNNFFANVEHGNAHRGYAAIHGLPGEVSEEVAHGLVISLGRHYGNPRSTRPSVTQQGSGCFRPKLRRC